MISIHAEVAQDGRPLRDLGVTDFVVRDKGKSVEVAEVIEIDFDDCDGGAVERPFRQLLFLFDLEFSHPQFMFRATDLAREMIEPGRLACTEVLIATHEPSTGMRIEVELTNDRDRLVETLGLLHDESERRLDSATGTASGPVVTGDDLIEARARNQESEKGIVQREQGRILGLIRTLARLESLTRSVPGSSQVVVFSPGFDSSVILGNQATQQFDAAFSASQSEASARGEVWAVNDATRYQGGLVEKALFEMLSDYDRSGVPIQVVKIEVDGADNRPVERGAQGPNGLTIMAERTGGQIYRGAGGQILEEIRGLEPAGAIYLLTFKTRSFDSGRYRKLDVRLKKSTKSVELSAPPGYYVP